IKSDAVNVDIAVAAVRPPQRDSTVPDGQAGIKVTLPHLQAWHTGGSTGTALDPAGIGVSVIGRRFSPNPFPGMPQGSQVSENGYGVSFDAIVPIVPATKEHHDNALTFTGSFVTGAGIADQYTGLSGGVGEPTPPTPMGGTAPVYTPNIDNGLALYALNADGT